LNMCLLSVGLFILSLSFKYISVHMMNGEG
jgi:hypothetical protein